MDEEIVRQIVDEVFSSLEPLDTQGAALLEFLKAKGIATEEELAPFLKQAGNTSSVRWLAARVRIKSLISSAMKDADTEPAETKSEGKYSGETKPEETPDSREKNSNQQAVPGKPRNGEPGKDVVSDENTQPTRAAKGGEKDENQKENNPAQPDEAMKERAA